MRSLRVGLVPLVVGSLAILGTLSGVGSLNTAWAAVTKSCGSVTVRGHTVNFTADNVSCSFVHKYANTMAKKSLKAHTARFGSVTISGGPSGYTCTGGTRSTPTGVQTSGTCSKGIGGVGPNSKAFLWSGN